MLSTLQRDRKLAFAITWFGDWLVELLQRVNDTSISKSGMLYNASYFIAGDSNCYAQTRARSMRLN